jgi:GH24 family phage-related lysozyme (muramidase)
VKTSLKGKQQIARREALVTIPYRDGGTDEKPRWSQGFGLNSTEGAAPITVEQAWKDLDEAILEYEGYVNKMLGETTVTQPMFDALVSLAFNTGPGGKQALIELIKAGDVAAAADQFLAYNKVKGVPSAGHTKRRNQERALFLNGVYGDLSNIYVWETDPRAHPKDFKLHPMPQE